MNRSPSSSRFWGRPYEEWWGRRVTQHELDAANAALASDDTDRRLSLEVERVLHEQRWRLKFRSALVENHLNHLTEARHAANSPEA